MAENIVASLFGLDPNDLRDVRQKQQEQAAQNFAQLDPFQRANYMLFRGGQEAAGVGAKMFGMQDPRLAEQEKNKSIQTQIDHTTPEGLLAGAKLFHSSGNPRMAAMYAQASQKMKEQIAGTAETEARANYYSKGGARGVGSASSLLQQLPVKQAVLRAQLEKIAFDRNMSPEESSRWVNSKLAAQTKMWIMTVKNLINNDPSYKPTEEDNMLLSEMEQGIDAPMNEIHVSADEIPVDSFIPPVTGDESLGSNKSNTAGAIERAKENEKILTAIDEDGDPVYTRGSGAVGRVNPQYSPELQSEITSAETTSTATAKENVEEHNRAIEDRDNLYKINNLISHIKLSGAETGLGAELFKNLARARAFLGSEEGKKIASDTELLDTYMGAEVFPLIGSLGIGARGMDTPAEREFMRQVLTGSIELNKNTLLRMATLRKESAENNIVKFNRRVNSGELDRYFRDAGRPKERVLIPGKGKFDLSTPEKRNQLLKDIQKLRKIDPREADALLNDFKVQLKRPKLTPEIAREILKERGLLDGE